MVTSRYQTAAHQESRDRQILAWDEDILSRFWAKYSAPDINGCETWLDKPLNGYGRFQTNGQNFRAHRASAVLRLGTTDYAYEEVTLHDVELSRAGLCVGKLCGTHIKLGSKAENGQAPDFAKLDWERVEEIRARYTAGGVSQQRLADEYGVNPSQISRIVNNKIWTNNAETKRGETPVSENDNGWGWINDSWTKGGQECRCSNCSCAKLSD
jgi:hypothetical protein